MSRDRFMLLLRIFHISDPDQELQSQDPHYNLIQKLEPLYSEIK